MQVELVISHHEEDVSDWVWMEYKHVVELWGSVVFTNVKALEERRRLAILGMALEDDFSSYLDGKRYIVLDPCASEVLRTGDLADADAIVVGGILGYERPRGRTRELITSRAGGAVVRNLGKKQLSVDTACLVAKMIYLGSSVDEIELTDSVEIRLSEGESVVLPYGYVVADGRLILTPGLMEYLSRDR
ncbi:MAG: hypothetical protein ACE5G7_02875 [Candidatus Hydrothermarchaeaceae archaeon]